MHLGIALVLAALAAVGCNKAPPSSSDVSSTSTSSAKKYDSKGVVKGFTEGRKAVLIAHEDIPNFMKAMTMPFDVTAPSVLEGFKEGDAVEFSFLEEQGGKLTIQSIKKRN